MADNNQAPPKPSFPSFSSFTSAQSSSSSQTRPSLFPIATTPVEPAPTRNAPVASLFPIVSAAIKNP